MKKETVNSFNAGMVKDLNNLVVPNDILIDNVNGAFLTYNGDELSLQTDAGNTKIKIGEDKYIKLSDDFHPLGVKEKGGVLYIVSGKRGFVNGVRDTDLDEIEIGSYPSPEFNRVVEFNGQILRDLSTDDLYESFIINTDIFKTSRFIRFRPFEGFNLDNIKFNGSTGLYIIKLLLMLENGEIDITDDINEDYINHIAKEGDTEKHWLSSNAFKYYCPYNYKGNLAIRVEVDEPTFQINSFIEEDASITINVYSKNSDALKITDTSYSFKVNNKELNEDNIQISHSANLDLIKYKINVTSDDKVEYKITPVLEYKSDELNFSDFPKYFRDKFTLEGTLDFQEISQSVWLEATNGGCYDEVYYYNSVIVMGEEGPLNPYTGNPVTNSKPYGFIREGTYNNDIISLGTYSTNGNLALINAMDENQSIMNLKGLLNSTQVIDPSRYCGEIKITIELSAALDIEGFDSIKNGFIRFMQVSKPSISYETTDGKTFNITVVGSEDLRIILESNPYYINHVIKTKDLTPNKTYKLGLVANFKHYSGKAGGDIVFGFQPNNVSQNSLLQSFHNFKIKKSEDSGIFRLTWDPSKFSIITQPTVRENNGVYISISTRLDVEGIIPFGRFIGKFEADLDNSSNYISVSGYVNLDDDYIGFGSSNNYIFVNKVFNLDENPYYVPPEF